MTNDLRVGELLHGQHLGTEKVRFSHGRLQTSNSVTRLDASSRGVLR